MARPREFDIDEATEGAMALFWSKGYEDVSLADLLAGMQVSRGSLYKAYGEKHSVWLAALDLYDQKVVQPTARALSDATTGPGLLRIARFLDAPAQPLRDNGDRRGCFLCNAAADRASLDEATRDRVLAMFDRLETAVRQALESDARDRGWQTAAVAQKAKTTIAIYVGLRVLVRAGSPIDAIEVITKAHLDSISST